MKYYAYQLTSYSRSAEIYIFTTYTEKRPSNCYYDRGSSIIERRYYKSKDNLKKRLAELGVHGDELHHIPTTIRFN